ncbi:MAG: DUF11 domain-containing protein [Nostocaceae cyanobacterium]|nr:DUF11 domain-containing protein [Nostocaceae cyanobacterium]
MSVLLKYLLAAKSRPISRYGKLLSSIVFSLVALSLGMRSAHAEGSRTLYPNSAPPGSINPSRANLEWRNDSYGSLVKRRTLLKVYANAGENILLGSSAVGVGSGDILVYNPNRISGKVGQETIPTTPDFKCSSQSGKGVISSRKQELAGPLSISGAGNSNSYKPCYYSAPSTGVYNVVFYGPKGDGFAVDVNNSIPGDVSLIDTKNFDTNQNTSVAAWDVTVRSSDQTSTSDINGRLFAYYYALNTGNNGRPLYFPIYPVTTDGYQYRITLRGTDPYGFLIYGNQVGFFDSDGKSSLYHDITSGSDQISSPDAGTSLASPQYPTFLNPLDTTVLSSLEIYGTNGNYIATGIPSIPITPSVSSISFTGTAGGNNSVVSTGGTFSFNSSTTGNYEIIISRGTDFDPTNTQNATLRGVISTAGSQSITWNGKDNSSKAPFPPNPNYAVQIKVHAGEYHFPLLDAENNYYGGPTTELLNATNPLVPFGNTTGFYDDRGYTTIGGNPVGTPGSALCGTKPPTAFFSDPIKGFDTLSNQRLYGQSSGGSVGGVCNGSFGDKKGLDLWTFFPSSAANTLLNIIDAAYNISGTLYLDKNTDKTFNNSEPTLPANITLKLIDPSNNSLIQTTHTDTNGNYTFTSVASKNYQVQVDTADTHIPAGDTLETPNNVPVTVNGSNITNINFGFIPPAGKPKLLLVKRITAITRVNIDTYVDDHNTTSTDDHDKNWPTPLDSGSGISSYLRGAINNTIVRPGDDIEYTIYFLSTGTQDATKVNICDLIPANTTFVPTTFNTQTTTDGGIPGTDKGIALALGSISPTVYLTNVNDPPDRGRFYPANDPATPPYCKANTNGAVEVNITRSSDFPNLPAATASGTPTNSYGFIRFHVKVK